MTTPDPNPLPGPPTYSVPLKPCCGLLESDFCDCAEWTAEVLAAFVTGPSVVFRKALDAFDRRGGRVEVTQ